MNSEEILHWCEAFLDTPHEDLTSQNHPLANDLRNIFGWKVQWWEEFVNIIDRIPPTSINREILKTKLKNKNSFREGLVFLYNMRCFEEAGCMVEFITETEDSRSVDLKITGSRNNSIFLECTQMTKTKEEKDFDRIFSMISQRITMNNGPNYELRFVGQILRRNIANRELGSLLKDIDRTMDEANTSGYSELVNSYINIAFASKSNYGRLQKVNASTQDSEELLPDVSSLRGPRFESIPLRRISTKIESKKKQIRDSKENQNLPNALFIEVDASFLRDTDSNCIEVEEMLKNTERIDMIVLFCGHVGGIVHDETRTINDNIIFINRSLCMVTREIAVIRNKFSKYNNETNNFYDIFAKAYMTATLLH